MRILVTGGCGFIGSHLTDELVRRGHAVTVFDRATRPSYCNPKAEYIRGDICDRLDGLFSRNFDAVYHLAAEVGSGISMADPQKYVRANSMGTANLLEAVRHHGHYPEFLLASSATVYGEATYDCPEHGTTYPDLRPVAQLERSDWEVKCPTCGRDMEAVAIKEDRTLKPASIYGLTKLEQELSSMLLGRAWGFPVVAFRLFGVFGPRQSLKNPYTGVIAQFATRVLSGLPITHYEDGNQNKGYIYIDDVVAALALPLEKKQAYGHVFNIGTTEPVRIRYIAEQTALKLNKLVPIVATGQFRASDTRHSWADVARAQQVLNWRPKISFDEGLDRALEAFGALRPKEISEAVAAFEKAEKYAHKLGLHV